jgi:3-oxoacyl-[acyl-carrier protein] reductase
MGELEGKVAVVTGGSRGIGRAVAERLAADGAAVVLSYRDRAAEADGVVARIVAAGGRALAVRADLASVADVRSLFAAALDRFGRLDIAVNNAGVAIYRPVAEATEEEFDASFAVNARGTFFALQEAARRIADGGRIVSISTGATVNGVPQGALYCGSKAAVEQFTKSLARELGPRGITVNTVSPGFTETGMLASLPNLREVGAAMSPLGRTGRPEEVAEVVAFLVGPRAGWLTGCNIQAGGGVTIV